MQRAFDMRYVPVIAVAVMAAIGGACGGSADAQVPVVSAPHRTDACIGAQAWAEPALDDLYALRTDDGESWVLAIDPLALDANRLAQAEQRFAAAMAIDPTRLSDPVRVVVQNDLWGLAQRLDRVRISRDDLDGLRASAWALVRRLALSGDRLAALEGSAIAPAVARRLPASEGWREVASEMPVLSHENLFGLRRIFRLAQRENEIALFSQIVALDDTGVAHQTAIAGEIEALVMGPDAAIAARVWELDRRTLRCEGLPDSLHEVDEVAHVPGRGANGFLQRFDPPAPLHDLPCLTCHHDADLQSLPTPDLAPSWRWPALLSQATTSATPTKN